MVVPLILASGSSIRQQMLRNAGIPFESARPRIDEEAIRAALLADAARPRDIADALAEMKARKISEKSPGALVIGSDQVLDFDGAPLGKPASPEDLHDMLMRLRGNQHMLHSAVVIYEDAKPVWRHIGTVRLRMHDLSDAFIAAYIDRNWNDVRHCAGGYMLEAEGVQLFSNIEGSYFSVLGLPLIELLSYLRLRGVTMT